MIVDPDEFFRQSLFDQVMAKRPDERRGCHWVMSWKTFNRIRRMTTAPGGLFAYHPPAVGEPETLLGYPIEFDEEAPGATFEHREEGSAPNG